MAGVTRWILLLSVIVSLVAVSWANGKTEKELKQLKEPFRMAKLNVLWSKATKRLSEAKLRSLLSDLKLQDKEEILWKKLRGEGKDKEGLKEAELRKKLRGIINTYGLSEHFEDTAEEDQGKADKAHLNKSLFKDKKLNKLWEKAEAAGFNEVELKTLREEFLHHQDKVDQYYDLLAKEEATDDDENHINRFDDFEESEAPSKTVQTRANMIKEKHQELKNGYNRLHRLAASGPEAKEFIEPKVQQLWSMALGSDFTPDELESLKTELKHYEQRLMKLSHLQAELVLVDERHKGKLDMDGEWDGSEDGEKTEGRRIMDDKVKKHARKVEKLHEHLEMRILQRHIEL